MQARPYAGIITGASLNDKTPLWNNILEHTHFDYSGLDPKGGGTN